MNNAEPSYYCSSRKARPVCRYTVHVTLLCWWPDRFINTLIGERRVRGEGVSSSQGEALLYDERRCIDVSS